MFFQTGTYLRLRIQCAASSFQISINDEEVASASQLHLVTPDTGNIQFPRFRAYQVKDIPHSMRMAWFGPIVDTDSNAIELDRVEWAFGTFISTNHICASIQPIYLQLY